MQTINLRFGALCEPIRAQLKAQSLKANTTGSVVQWQKLSDSIVRLYVCGYIGDSQKVRLQRKLIKSITSGVSIAGVK